MVFNILYGVLNSWEGINLCPFLNFLSSSHNESSINSVKSLFSLLSSFKNSFLGKMKALEGGIRGLCLRALEMLSGFLVFS
jgi:hypothetical protein